MYIDSHSHLKHILNEDNFVLFSKKHSNPYTFSNLMPDNIDYIINISLHPSEFSEEYSLFSRDHRVFFASGIYPSYAVKPNESLKHDLETLRTQIKEYPVIAVGETGIDQKNQDYGSLAEQSWLFEQQILLAEEFNLPIIIHSRMCFEECWNIVKSSKAKVIIHCFSYGIKEAEQVITRGDMISFAGNLTYPQSHEIQEVARMIPIEYILLETDSPYLSPEPLRGHWNIPIHIMHTYEYLSSLRNINLDTLSQEVKKNFLRCFRIT